MKEKFKKIYKNKYGYSIINLIIVIIFLGILSQFSFSIYVNPFSISIQNNWNEKKSEPYNTAMCENIVVPVVNPEKKEKRIRQYQEEIDKINNILKEENLSKEGRSGTEALLDMQKSSLRQAENGYLSLGDYHEANPKMKDGLIFYCYLRGY